MLDIKIYLFEKLSPFHWWNKIKYNKSNVRILFIDDEKMPIVNNLKKAGFNVEEIKDVKNIDIDEVRRSHIIFVDYKGVGKNISPSYEGIGLIKALKDKYSKSKRVILYSAHNQFPKKIVLNQIFNLADDKILKNADFTDFLEVINCQMKKIR